MPPFLRLSPRAAFVLRAGLAAAAVFALVRLAHPASVGAALGSADVRWVLGALVLLPLNVGLDAVRWARLVRQLAPGVRLGEAVRAVVAAYPLGLLTPGRVGDYAGRAALVRALPPAESAALTFAERMATFGCCLAGGLVALGLTLAERDVGAWAAAAAVGIAGVAALGAAFARPAATARVLGGLGRARVLRQAADAFGRVPRREAGVLVALSALRYAVFTAQFVCLVRAFAPGAALGAVAVGVMLTFFAKSAVPQLTLGDLGVREGAAVVFLAGAGVPAAAALNASLSVFVVNLVLPALAGVPLLMRARPPAPDAPPVERAVAGALAEADAACGDDAPALAEVRA